MIGINHKIRELLIFNCKMVDYEVVMADNISIYDQLQTLELNNISGIHPYIQNILVFLSCSSKLRQMTLCNCQLQPDVTKQILMVLNNMRHLETVDLSGNDMTDDSVSDMEAMIVNNEQLRGLCLPNCVLNQASLITICRALQTLSSLQYIDLSTNKIDSELASDIAVSITKNSKLKELKISELVLIQSNFQHLYKYLVKIKGLTTVNIIGCSFIGQNVEKLVTVIVNNNSEIQELNLSNCIMPANQSWSMLSCITKLKYLNLSQCLLKPNETKEIFGILKRMNCLQHVDLSANIMDSNAVNDVAAMIKNNQNIQVLSLPNCVLDLIDLKIIIQAMQTVSSLEYVDFNNNTVDDELASDVALLFTNNIKLKEFRFAKLFTLNQIGFEHLNAYLVKMKGLTAITIIGCTFIAQNAIKLVTVIRSNPEIQELNLSNCRMPANQSWSMLSCIPKLKYLNLSQCLLQPNKTNKIFGILKRMNCLQHVDLSANNMRSDAVNDVAAMIKNNQDIQVLSIPKCILDQKDLRIIIQAMQTVSSLEYVDFNNNTVDNELASDVALLFTKNSKMKELRFTKLTLNQNGFQHLNNYLGKIKGLTTINIIGCYLMRQNTMKLVTTIINNHSEIQELNLSNCRMSANQSWSMLSCITKLKYLNLSRCLLQPNETKKYLAS